MRKVRSLSGIDFGVILPSANYKQTTGTIWRTLYPWPRSTEDTCMSQHLSLVSSATRVLSGLAYVDGNEVFESTEFRKPLFNNCYHAKDRFVNYPYTCCYNYAGSYGVSGLWRHSPGIISLATTSRPDWSQVSSNMQAEAYHSMLPRFEGNLSLLNSLFELKDFRDIGGFLAPKFNLLKERSMYKELMELRKFATKRLAETHLMAAFAIDPLIKDISDGVGQAQKLVMDVQEEFRQKGLLPDARHFSKTLTQSQDFTNTNVLGSNQFWSILKGSKSSTRWTCTMEGTYGYTARSDLDAFLKYWGLTFTAEALWNALPFSFLVDYVFQIGHSLNVMRHDPNVTYHVGQYCESLLNVSTTGYYIGLGTTQCGLHYAVDDKLYHNDELPKHTHIAGSTSQKYERVVKSPYWGPYLPGFKMPTDKQSLNCLALLRCLL